MPIMNYNDPNDAWRMTGYDPYKGMTDNERMLIGCLQGAAFILTMTILLALWAIF